MRYEVINTADGTVICDSETGLKARVSTTTGTTETAFALGTLYTITSGFTLLKVYQFQAITGEANAESLKKIAAFFFASLLDTELYVLEIPQDSTLFQQEAERIFGAQEYERAI